MASKQVNTILTLKDRMSAPLVRVSKNMEGVSRSTQRTAAEVNRMGRKFERTVDRGIKSTMKWAKRLAILGAGTSIKLGIDGLKEIEYGAAKVDSIARGALKVHDIQEGILEMSTKLGGGITPEQVADAQYSAISSGIDPAMSLDFTEVAGKLSVAGFTDIDSSIRLITSIMNAFNLKTMEDAYKIADELLYTQNKGVILVDEMANLYGSLVPYFASMDLGMEDLNVAVATVTKMGMPAAQAVTSIRSAINSLIKPSKEASEYAASIGIELGGSALKAKGFGGMMSEILEKTGGDIDKIVKIFPNARALLAGLNLTSEQGSEIFKDILENYGDAEGLLEEAFETMSNTIPYRVDSIKQSLKNLNTMFYMDERFKNPFVERLKEIDEYLKSDEGKEKALETFDKIYTTIDKIIDKLIDLFKFIDRNKEGLKDIGKGFGITYLAMKLARAISAIYKTIKPIKDFFVEGGLELGSVGKLGAVIFIAVKLFEILRENWDELSEKYPRAMEAIDTIKEKIPEAFDWIKDKASEFKDAVSEMFTFIREGIIDPIIDLFFEVADGLVGAFEGLKEFFGGLKDIFENELTFENVFEGVKRSARGLWTFIDEIWGNIIAIITKPIETKIELYEDKFEESAKAIRDEWDKIKSWLRNPITGTVKIVQEKWQSFKQKRGIGNTWTGTNYWRGGLTHLHERGGEIYDLPQGTRVYPHDESVQMAFQEGMNLGGGDKGSSGGVDLGGVHIYGNVYGEDDLVSKVGNGIVNVLQQNLPNMV